MFLLILGVATIARVEKLDNSLWYDEILSLVNFVRLPLTDLLSVQFSFNNHAFYNLQAKASILLFGESNWSIRLPAVLFGIAGIAAVWRLAYSISGALQAHISALLISLSYHHVWFSQNARGYTELMFWCVASTIMLLGCLRNPSWRGWFVYGLIIAAGSYTHLTACVFFLAQGIYVIAAGFGKHSNTLSVRKKYLMPLAGFLSGATLTLLLYLPSLGHILGSILSVPGGSSVDVMQEYQSPFWAALEIFRSLGKPGPLTVLTAFASITLTAIGMVSIFKKEPLIPSVFVLHVVLMLAMLLAISMRVWPRFFFIDLGFVLYFMTQGVFVCCQQIAQFLNNNTALKFREKQLFILSSTVMIALSTVLLVRNYQFPKQNFDASIQYIEERQQQNDKVVTLGFAAVPYNKYYGMGWQVIATSDELKQVEAKAANTWIVLIFPSRTTRKFIDIMSQVDKRFSLAKTFRGTLGEGDILIYLSNRNGGK